MTGQYFRHWELELFSADAKWGSFSCSAKVFYTFVRTCIREKFPTRANLWPLNSNRTTLGDISFRMSEQLSQNKTRVPCWWSLPWNVWPTTRRHKQTVTSCALNNLTQKKSNTWRPVSFAECKTCRLCLRSFTWSILILCYSSVFTEQDFALLTKIDWSLTTLRILKHFHQVQQVQLYPEGARSHFISTFQMKI